MCRALAQQVTVGFPAEDRRLSRKKGDGGRGWKAEVGTRKSKCTPLFYNNGPYIYIYTLDLLIVLLCLHMWRSKGNLQESVF